MKKMTNLTIKKRQVLLATFLFMYMYPFAQAGQENTVSLNGLLAKLQATYRQAGCLSFDIKYIWTDETRPSTVLDSLSGSLAVHGNKYDLVLDNTETVKNDRYTISLLKEDRAIYVNNAPEADAASPLAVIDSAIARSGYKQVTLTQKGVYKTINILFPEGGAYKSLSITVDTLTGLLHKTQYLVKAELLTGGPEQNAGSVAGQRGRYALVEADFYNYKKGQFTDDLFDERNFFRMEGNNAEPTAKYKNYHVFKATTNL